MAQNPAFLPIAKDELKPYDRVTCAGAKCLSITLAARRAESRVTPIATHGADAPMQAVVDACLSLLRHIRSGRPHDAARVAQDIPQMAHIVGPGGTIRIDWVFR